MWGAAAAVVFITSFVSSEPLYDEYLSKLRVSNEAQKHLIRFEALAGVFDPPSGPVGFMPMALVEDDWCDHPSATTNWADINGDGKVDMLCDDHEARSHARALSLARAWVPLCGCRAGTGPKSTPATL